VLLRVKSHLGKLAKAVDGHQKAVLFFAFSNIATSFYLSHQQKK